MAYVDNPARNAIVKAWEVSVPVGAAYTITEAGKAVCALLPPHKSWIGYRGQSVARVLIENCGWVRKGRMLIKPMPGDAAQVDEEI